MHVQGAVQKEIAREVDHLKRIGKISKCQKCLSSPLVQSYKIHEEIHQFWRKYENYETQSDNHKNQRDAVLSAEGLLGHVILLPDLIWGVQGVDQGAVTEQDDDGRQGDEYCELDPLESLAQFALTIHDANIYEVQRSVVRVAYLGDLILEILGQIRDAGDDTDAEVHVTHGLWDVECDRGDGMADSHVPEYRQRYGDPRTGQYERSDRSGTVNLIKQQKTLLGKHRLSVVRKSHRQQGEAEQHIRNGQRHQPRVGTTLITTRCLVEPNACKYDQVHDVAEDAEDAEDGRNVGFDDVLDILVTTAIR